jgi:translation initiation factor IF-2
MTEIDEQEAGGTEQLSRPRKLELKKTVETGQVRQSFSHGRSKMVTVEVRKKRTFKTDARGRMSEVRREAEAAEAAAAARAIGRVGEGIPREGVAVGLTNHEKQARIQALLDARRAGEEPPADLAADMSDAELDMVTAELEADAADALVVEPAADAGIAGDDVAASDDGAAEEPAAAPEDAAVVEAPAPPDAAEQPAAAEALPEPSAPDATPPEPPAPVVVPPPAPDAEPVPAKGKAAAEDSDSEARARARRGARAEPKRSDGSARRDDASRRAGKLSLTEALDEGAERVRSLASVRRARQKEKMKHLQQLRSETQKIIRDVVIPETITVQELANRMAERGADVIKALMRQGVMATINQSLDADTAELIVGEFGHNVKRVSEADVEIGLKGEADDEGELSSRPPVVTVMGHVDHGKTSLLDALRKSDVADHEAGGITQHIGAYQVTMPSGAKITFIDTPGHEAFTQMRARGARSTDIVVLVVAADDGVMPQTIEAINHAKAAEVALIVAVNKIDRPDAQPQRVRTALMQYGVFVEDMGGETLCVDVSAKTGANLDKLAEAIALQAELLDLKANADRPAEGVVIETKIERGRGTVATLLVQRGTLRVGDIFVAGSEWGRVRGMMDAAGASLEDAGPSTPVEVLGLGGTPGAGDEFVVVESEGRAREVTEFRQRRLRDARTATSSSRGTLEQMLIRIQEGETKELPVVIKGDVHGSVEAIMGALQKLGTDEVRVNVLHHGVGGINETDIGLARATDAVVIGFNVRANPQARQAAKRDGVELRYYSIIYDLTNDIRDSLTGMLSPKLKETILGYAQIREVFSITKVGKVAGCMVTEGMVRRGAKVRLLRDDVVIHDGEIGQLKRFKEDAREVKEGYDCGISFANYQDIQVGDQIECYDVESIAQTL